MLKKYNHFQLYLDISIIILFIFISQINISQCSTCKKGDSISDKNCFNDILRFNNKKYRAGHFVTYKNKDLIVEFSDDGWDSKDGFARKFYGLKSNGRFYFENEIPTYEIENIGQIDSDRGRYESFNLLVTTEDDLSRENEFLFSTSLYGSLTELHKIQEKIYNYTRTTSFVGKIIFSFQYSVVEVEYNSKIFYFIAFTYSSTDKRNGDCINIKKFGFKSFSFNDINTYNNKVISITDNKDNRIVNLFSIKNLNILVLVYDRKDNNNNYLTLKFYDYDLNEKGSSISLGSINIVDPTNRDKDGVFFKSVELPDNKRAFMIYYSGNADELHFNIYQFSKNNDNSMTKTDILKSKTTGYWFLAYVTFNDIYTINDNRIAIVTSSANKEVLVFLMYDLYNDYKNFIRRRYFFNIKGFPLNKELSLHSFNDYLIFTMTGGEYFADLMIFGFANGTDSVIDIAPYLIDSPNYNQNLNLLREMYNNITIDNNIFGYVKVEQIKIVSIPEQLKFYNGKDESKIEITNDEIIDINIDYSLYQIKNLIKTDVYYDLYYQGKIKELEYDSFYAQSHQHEKYAQDNNNYNGYRNDFKAKEFYGRTNKLSFKLCHDYCSTCYELGDLIDRQNCQSCLP